MSDTSNDTPETQTPSASVFRSPDPRRVNRDPDYVNRPAADGRPDVTTDNTGARVLPVDPPWLQTPPEPEVSDQSDSWIEAAGITKPADAGTPPEDTTRAAAGSDGDLKTQDEVKAMNRTQVVSYATAHDVDATGTKDQIAERVVAAGKVRS
jgi:hypothetical protein